MRSLNLLVLRCPDLEKSREFYERFGMKFEQHKHGDGPLHLACEDDRGTLELYPSKSADKTGLGFAVDDLGAKLVEFAATAQRDEWGEFFVVRDPDGRRVEVRQRKKAE